MDLTDDFELGGLVKFSTLDYPGRMSAVLFTRGCPCTCPYCHNWSLNTEAGSRLSWGEARSFLETRRGILDAVTVTGGEPMLMGPARMSALIGWLHRNGFLVKLDTSGLAGNLRKLTEMPDYLAIDIKSPADGYGRFLPGFGPWQLSLLRANLSMVPGRGEVRTTVHRSLLSPDDLRRIRTDFVDDLDGVPWYLQQFRGSDGIRNPELKAVPTYSDAELSSLAGSLGALVRGVAHDPAEKPANIEEKETER